MRRLGIVLFSVFALAGCGRDAGTATNTSSSAGGRGFATRTWYDPAYEGDSKQRIRLTFDGPAGEGCDERDEAVADESEPDVVTVSVKFYEPYVPASCSLNPRSVVVNLKHPLGTRRLQRSGRDASFRDEGGRLVVIPESTACGRADCSTASPAPAPCTYDAYEEAIARNVDGGLHGEDARCDGSFLVLTIANRSACLPEQHNADCTRSNAAYFVANAGAWKVVTLGRGQTCDDVWQLTRIRFPASLCRPGAEESPGLT